MAEIVVEPVNTNKKKEYTFQRLNNQINIPVDGKIPLEKDLEAVRAYFIEYINENTMFFHSLKEKLDYLVEGDYINEKEIIEPYSFEFIKEIFKTAYSYKFRFKSFMAAKKFFSQYALRTDDREKFLERYEDRIAFNALAIAKGDEEFARELVVELMTQRYQPATPTFLNAGRKRSGDLVSCFLLDVNDDMPSIAKMVHNSLMLSKGGGGVGINLSSLRGLGDTIKKISNAASGIVPVMKIAEDLFSYANQLGCLAQYKIGKLRGRLESLHY